MTNLKSAGELEGHENWKVDPVDDEHRKRIRQSDDDELQSRLVHLGRYAKNRDGRRHRGQHGQGHGEAGHATISQEEFFGRALFASRARMVDADNDGHAERDSKDADVDCAKRPAFVNICRCHFFLKDRKCCYVCERLALSDRELQIQEKLVIFA